MLAATTAFIALAAPAYAGGSSSANTAGPPTTLRHVQPTYAGGNITSCPKGTTTFLNTSNTTPGNLSLTYSSGGTTFQVTVDPSGTFIAFLTNSPSFTVYVKGGPAWDTYDYTGTTGHPNYPSDTGLHPPINNGAQLAMVSHYLVCGQPATSTKAHPTLNTTPSAAGTVGVVVLNDTAVLASGSSPTGSITLNLYDPAHPTCTGTPAYTQTVTVAGNGSYSTTNVAAATVPGTWSWTATYTGDVNNNDAVSTCGSETVTVAKASPTLGTTAGAGGLINVAVLNDSAALASGYNPTGTITFNLYDPTQPTCSGTPAYTQAVTVSGNGSYSTTNAATATMAGTWNWVASYSGDVNNKVVTTTCGAEPVTVTAVVPQGSCAGSGSLSALVSGTNVTSYVPKGSWDNGATGIDVVNVEGTSITNTTIPTTDAINSCASNPVTGQTVCTANNADVWVLKGTALDPAVSPNPLVDGGTGTINFSGGSATTSGVSMDATANRALLGISVGGVGGFQFLDLNTDTFSSPTATQDPGNQISEDPLIDPVHHVIASASESNNFELIDVTTGSWKFYEHPVPVVSGTELDATAEDCATGILIAPAEFSDSSQIEVADIQNAGSTPEAVFTTGTPGTWTAPEQLQTLTGSSLAAGASGAAVAQGTHTGVITGEFGGDGLTALAMPTTSGAGAVPAMSNWVTCHVGNDPSNVTFNMGLDPHTLFAYQSPNGGDAIALLVNDGATEMAVVDLTKMLDGTSVPSTGNVCDSTTLPGTVESFISLP